MEMREPKCSRSSCPQRSPIADRGDDAAEPHPRPHRTLRHPPIPPARERTSMSAVRATMRRMQSRHVSTVIRRSPREVYDYAADPDHLPAWAAGLTNTPVTREGDELVADSPMGRIRISFAPHNDFGVLDHWVTVLPNTAPPNTVLPNTAPPNTVLPNTAPSDAAPSDAAPSNTAPPGETTYNALRVIAHPDGAEVIFTLRQLEMTDDDFARDAGLVAADLERLREILEAVQG
jgi:hypothetical protein